MLNYPNYGANKNKIEVKTPRILLALNGRADSKKVNPRRPVLSRM